MAPIACIPQSRSLPFAMAMASLAGLLLACTRPVHAGEQITVARIKLTASLVCADGREAQLAHMAMSVPQRTGSVTFSPPFPTEYDPYSLWWMTINPCAAPRKEQVKVDMRNVTTTGFIASATASSLHPSWIASEHGQVVMNIGDAATLTIQSEVIGTESYHDSFEAARAARAASAEYDAKEDVPSRFGGVGPAMSWATATDEP